MQLCDGGSADKHCYSHPNGPDDDGATDDISDLICDTNKNTNENSHFNAHSHIDTDANR